MRDIQNIQYIQDFQGIQEDEQPREQKGAEFQVQRPGRITLLDTVGAQAVHRGTFTLRTEEPQGHRGVRLHAQHDPVPHTRTKVLHATPERSPEGNGTARR